MRTNLDSLPEEFYGCICEDSTCTWRNKDELTTVYDSDDDGVPRFFDCNDNDGTVYGDFVSHDGPVPMQICGDGKPNTCGLVYDESDECDDLPVACETYCKEEDQECDYTETTDGGVCCGDDASDFAGVITEADGNKQALCCLIAS